jgi:hypothetical protein
MKPRTKNLAIECTVLITLWLPLIIAVYTTYGNPSEVFFEDVVTISIWILTAVLLIGLAMIVFLE